tara:strand:+ start:455 stop:751 length:297 start_codon:yes stop_codon:yes gene_type:complete
MEHKMAENETDRSVEIKDMLDSIIAGNNADAQQQFNDQMASRTGEALDALKQDTAASVFGKAVDPNMEPQGVALDDALVDIDQTTGMPVEGETNGEDI